MDANNERDQYGGLKRIHFEATGFFRLEQADGRWWLVTPHYENQRDRAEAFSELMRNCFLRTDFVGWNWCGWMDRWESVQPRRQHSGIQDPFGKHYPIVEAMKKFSEEMYAITTL
jgi:hypothetical protein